jgi:peroxiredoxin/outer membrane lipoprotein-sorting protein
MQFSATDKAGDKSSTVGGTIAFSRPNKAKVVVKTGSETSVNLTDGKKLYRQVSAKMFQGTLLGAGQDAIEGMLQSIPSALSVFLPALVSGNDLLDSPEFPWASATLGDDGAVVLRPRLGEGGPAMAFSLYIDPTDKLLHRVEANIEYQGRTSSNNTILTEVKTNPQFSASEFAFTAGPGVKVVAEVPMYDDKLKVGVAPYALKGKDLQGKTHPWAKYKGKVVLLDFWATWCGPCIGELPNVLKNYATYHPKGFEIIGVSLDSDKKALTDFIKARKLTYANLYDGKGWQNVDGQSYGVRAIPFTLLIGKDGKIAAINPRGEALEPALKKALAVKLPAAKAAIAAKPATAKKASGKQ